MIASRTIGWVLLVAALSAAGYFGWQRLHGSDARAKSESAQKSASERPAAVQPEPRSRRFEPVAPSVSGKRDNRENAAVSEPGPRNKMRN